jgi:ribosomal protein L7Ae-like RNA K-turn-binding protein
LDLNKIKGYINISHKAGYLIIGSDLLKSYDKKLYLVIYDKSAMKNTLKVVEKIKEKNIPTIEVDDLENLTSIKNCKIIGIKNKNLSSLIEKLFEE